MYLAAALHDHRTEPGSADLPDILAAVEHLKQRIPVSCGDADASIDHFEDGPPLPGSRHVQQFRVAARHDRQPCVNRDEFLAKAQCGQAIDGANGVHEKVARWRIRPAQAIRRKTY
jgi:hypothetical protein